MNTLGARGKLPPMDRPRVVCLCGSTRFSDAFKAASMDRTLNGEIVLAPGCSIPDDDIFETFIPEAKRLAKAKLDVLHFRKIDLADYILVLNVEGYVGESTEREIEYARSHNKPICWLEDPHETPELLRPVS